MGKKIVRTIPYRRKQEKRTDYLARRKLLTGARPRLVVRRSLRNISLQIVDYYPSGDRVLVSAHSRELIKFGWNGSRKNLPACYLTGLLLARKAKAKKIREVISDLGLYRIVHGSRLFAALKGVKDGSLAMPLGEKAAPKEERITGRHIRGFKNDFNELKKKLSA